LPARLTDANVFLVFLCCTFVHDLQVLATLALSTSCVQQLWVVEQVVASGGRQGAAHDRAGSTGGRALSGVESRSKTYGKAAGGTYILAKTREGLEGTLVDLSRDMVVQGRGRGDVARAARLGDSAGGHLDSPNCFVASFSAHRTAILVGALPHHVGESLVMLDLGMPSKLSGKALALDQVFPPPARAHTHRRQRKRKR
jgi:hypothetical protein